MWDLRRVTLELWELLRKFITVESSISDLQDQINNLPTSSSTFVTVSITSPNGSSVFTDNIVTRLFLITPNVLQRTIKIGTTLAGEEVLTETVIPANESMELSWIRYYESPTFYFEIDQDSDVYIFYDYISTTPIVLP